MRLAEDYSGLPGRVQRHAFLVREHPRVFAATFAAQCLDHVQETSMPSLATAAQRLATDFPNVTTILRAVSIRAHIKQWKAAEEIVDRGLQMFPQDRQLLEAKRELEQEVPVPAKKPAYCTTGRSEVKSLSRL
jgi:hypothetical protein